MSRSRFEITDYGESAVMVRSLATEADDRQTHVQEFRERILLAPPPGFEDAVSGLESILVEFDPAGTTPEQMAYALDLLDRATRDEPAVSRPPRSFLVPIVIDDETAPDLGGVAGELGVTVDEAIRMIEESEFAVALLAAAMAPMMTGLAVPAPLRRQSTPRADVPAGSLMIVGRNAIIQPFPGPSGWRVVGRTPLRIVDIARASPVAFAPGDRFRFVRRDAAQVRALAGSFLEAVA